jgi:16S rRNA processing protein RimM
MHKEADLIELGYISGFYGVKGWVKVFSNTNPKENILKYRPWLIKLAGKGWTEVEVLNGRLQGKGVVAQLAGYADKDATLPLLKATIAIKADQLPECADGEYYWRDLIGFDVINQQGVNLGKVKGVMETGVHDVMVVSGKSSKDEVLIPWVHDVFILKVDSQQQQIQVDWQEEEE